MQAMDAAKQLCQAIQESPEYREYAARKEEIAEDEGISALVREYKRLQAAVQMRLLSGGNAQDDETIRFQHLNALLFADPRTSSYLLAEMRLQKTLSDIFEMLMAASGIEFPRPS